MLVNIRSLVYRQNHKDEIRQRQKEWYIKNRERVLEKQREYRNKKKENN